MKKIHSDIDLSRQPWYEPWSRFWFNPVDPIGMHVLRLMTGLLLLLLLLPLAGQADALFGLAGWIDREALQAAADPNEGLPPLGWSVLYLAGDSAALIQVIYWASIVVVALFTLGLAVRVTAVLSWVVVVSFLSNPAIAYDADFLLLIPTFYLMIGYVFYGQFSRDASILDRILGPRDAIVDRLFVRGGASEESSHAANFAVRLFQVHFALVMVASLLHKLNMAEWWSGVAFFYPLHSPYGTTRDDLIALAPSSAGYFFMLSLAQYLVLAWQFAFPFFAWKRSFRILLLGGAVAAWIGNMFIFGLPLFGPFVLIACLNYLTPAEWRGIQNRLRPVLTHVPARVETPRHKTGIKVVKHV